MTRMHLSITASIVTALWALAMFGPVELLNLLALIVVMLPLWMIHDLGVTGLGNPENGFFVPTSTGYVVGAVVIWFIVFLLLAVVLRGKALDRGPRGHG